MQIMITHGSLATTRVLHLNRIQIGLAVAALTVVLMLFSGLIYHFVFLKAAREGWPVVSSIVRLVVRDEFAQRDRFVRENLDVIATKVGEMQAKLLKLEAMGDRVSGLAGVKPEEFKPVLSPRPGASAPVPSKTGQGGPFIPGLNDSQRGTLDALAGNIDLMDERADQYSDLFTLIESRLLEGRLAQLLIPSTTPVAGPVGSGFGFRTDPITGRGALHMGLDFPADVGTPIVSAAGGVVINTENHAAYGNMVDIDHGSGLVTRYAHASKLLVKTGDLVKRGQAVALVGNTGRSTGPHLHFEVLVDGVPQNPARFLAGRGGDAKSVAGSQRGR
jgi:murein DD-endopeptidase MepM/ murein hydrolase activator NlpD